MWDRTPDYFRARAQRCRTMAALARQPEVKQALEELAAEFEEMVREMEEGKAGRSGPEGGGSTDPTANS